MASPHNQNYQTPPAQPSPPFDLKTLFKPPQPPMPNPNVPPPPYQDYSSNLHLHRSLSYPIPPLPPPSNSGARLMALLSAPLPNSNPGILPLPNSVHNSSTLVPVGRRLVGDNVVYDIDGKLKGDVDPPQLEVSPITKYVSDPQLVVGRQIAVNGTYICYGLKMGNIRVLDINTALRSLLKGHTARVSDMTFFAEDVHLLASASVNGRFYVWRLSEGQDEEEKPQITGKLVIAVQVLGEDVAAHPRVCWHCHKQEILVIGMGPHILRLDTTRVGKGEVYSAEEPLKFSVDKLIDGVQYVGKHDGEITDLSMCQWMTTRLVSASTDGTIKIWEDRKTMPVTILRPHDGNPVSSAAFLTAPHQPDHIILLTGGPINQEMKLWASANDEGWLVPSDTQPWNCIQTLKLKSSDGSQVEDVFFNQVFTMSQPGLLLLANAKKNAIYAVHLEYGFCPTATRMNYIAEFMVTMPILSFTGTSISLPYGEQIVKLYCVQTQAIQQYALNLSQCLPPPMENSGLGKSDSAISFEASSPEGLTFVETSSSKAIETVLASPTLKPTRHDITSEGAPAVTSSSYLTCTEASNSNEFTASYIPEPVSNALGSNAVASPSLLSPKLSGRLSGFSMFSDSSDPGLLADRGADRQLVDCSVEHQISSGFTGLSESTKKDGKSLHDEISSVADPPPTFKHPTHLITPSEILMAASSLENTSNISNYSRGDLKTQDLVMNSDVSNKEMKIKVVEQTSSTLNSVEKPPDASIDRGFKQKTFVSQASDIAVKVKMDTSETYMPQDRQINGTFPTESINQPQNDDGKEVLDSTTQASGKAAGVSMASTVQGLPTPATIGEKQDGADSQILGSPFISANDSELMDFSSVPAVSSKSLESIFSQILLMQEMLNESMTMQKEMQKQFSVMAAVPVTKEGKRLEIALGRIVEKAVKTNSDALWARLQEESAKMENLYKEHTEKMTSMFTSTLSKELPAMVERTVKKELTVVGPTVARAILPVVEKSISSAIMESFQKGVGDKAVNQLEKSLNSKLEASVARQIHSQFQTSGKHALQESLRSTLEATIIPAFEQSCRAMFEHVDATFQKGMIEHATAAQKHFESTHSPLALALRDGISSASSMIQTLSLELSDAHKKLLAVADARANPNPVNPLVTQLGSGSVGSLNEKQVEVPFDPKVELSRFVSEHKYEEAFSAALQRSDVSIVSWLCVQVDLQRILSMAPPPLSQRVLLFLFQQLACDLQKDTPRKLGWMRDIAVVINPADPTIAIHLRPIFEQVYQILNHHCNLPSTTGGELTSIRVILHVINSILLSYK